tara:strand:+ start:479 stop:1210 length:732 start_codon:yes stop_codon:yes gene_type:complete
MEKNWLIRTHQNQILGPISKERVIELIKKGNLISEDEICSGNGFWFQVKEKEFLDRYIYNDEKQTFNPVSEAKSIFIEGEIEKSEFSRTSEADPSLPKNSDLEFPEIKKSDHEGKEEEILPESNDLEFPEEPGKMDVKENEQVNKIEKPAEVSKKSISEKKSKRKKIRKKKLKKRYEVIEEPNRNDRFLFYIFLLLLLILLGVFIFYKNTLNNLFPKSSSFSLIFPSAVAQTINVKKKNNLKH